MTALLCLLGAVVPGPSGLTGFGGPAATAPPSAMWREGSPPARQEASPPAERETAGELREVLVRIEIAGGMARVEATYLLIPGREPAFHGIRLPGQRLEVAVAGTAATGGGRSGWRFAAAPSGGPRVEVRPGLYRLRLVPGGEGSRAGPAGGKGPTGAGAEGSRESGGRGEAPVRARVLYTVAGSLRRIPLFIPGPSPPPEGARIELRVRGLPRDAALRGGFPRLRWEPGGDAVARTAHLPSFVRLPASRPGPSFGQLADASALVAVLLGTAVWLRWRRRARAPTGGGSPR